MDKAKLEKLRERYTNADGSEYLTERFRHVGEKLADRPNNTAKPYAGVPTFLDLPYKPDFGGLDVAIVDATSATAKKSLVTGRFTFPHRRNHAGIDC